MKISSSLGLGATTLSPMANAKILKSVGFDGIDFQFCGQYSTTNIFREGVTEGIIAKCEEIKKIGLEISQTHLHYLSSEHYGPGRYPEFEKTYLDAIIREIEICGAVGCPVAVLHTYFEEDREATIKANMTFFEKLMPHLEKHKVGLALENVFSGGDAEYGADKNNAKAEDFMVYFEEFDSPYLGACLDTGHAHCVNEDPVAMAKTYGKYLLALHMNSNCGRDIHMLPGMMYPFADPTDWTEFSKTLKEIGYKGTYNLEVSNGYYPHDPIAGINYIELAYRIARKYADLAE